jgi:hypothetical protein
MSPGFNSFLLLRDDQNSKCVWGVLAVIKFIYLPPTYLHFTQDIENKCLLLTSSTSFVDLPFQEHQVIEKHHMDQNPYISSLCPNPRVITNNMTWGDSVAKVGPAGQGLACFQNPLSPRVKLSRQEGNPKWERRCSNKTWPPGQPSRLAGLTSGPPEPQLWPRHQLNPPINTPILLLVESVKKVRFSLL